MGAAELRALASLGSALDPTATLAARFRGVRYLIRQRTFGP